jgi:hypothetical protein
VLYGSAYWNDIVDFDALVRLNIGAGYFVSA